MEWTPAPDGIAMWQGGVTNTNGRRRRPWIRLASSGSIWRKTAFSFTLLGRDGSVAFHRKLSRGKVLLVGVEF